MRGAAISRERDFEAAAADDSRGVKLAVYTDYVYRRSGEVIYAERAFALFLAALAPHFEQVTLIGRLAPGGEARYALPTSLRLAPLRYYGSLANPAAALRSLAGSIREMWRALEDVELLWVLGPYPHAIALVLLARLRRRRVVLGVRQDWPTYVRSRHPRRRLLHLAADVLEWAWRRLASRRPVVAVGPELSKLYAHAPSVLDLTVSLVPASAVRDAVATNGDRSTLNVLSVGRLETEKNPLLLADVLHQLLELDPRWRLLVAGEGEMARPLADRLEQLGVAGQAQLLGYVPMGEVLLDLYRSSYAMLHVSLTEGFPQVLIEAFASGLPVVATAVGGVASGVADAALLIPPDDAGAAARGLLRLVEEPGLRERLIRAGLERAKHLTLEAQTARLASFLLESSPNFDARIERARS